jgi:transcriptional regulator with GAF, ATPase, and Fis domain
MSEDPRGVTRSVAEREQQLAETFVMLADTLVDDYDVVELLNRLAECCVSILGATAAGILLVDQRGKLAVVASSSDRSRLLEVFQLQRDEGPCLDCIRSGEPVTVSGLEPQAARWPRFVPAALESGYQSVDAVPMRLRDSIIGGLNLFHSAPESLPAADRRIAQALADVATIGILQQRSIHRSSVLAEQLQGALNSRIAIEQAKGFIAHRHDIDFDVAFAAMRKYARDHNLKLGEVALAVTRRELDPSRLLELGGSGRG